MFKRYFHLTRKLKISDIFDSLIDYLEKIFFFGNNQESENMKPVQANHCSSYHQLKYRNQQIARKLRF